MWSKNMYKDVINKIRSENIINDIDNIREAAKNILSIADNSIPIKIVEICNQMGFSIYQQSLPSQICGYIMVNGELKDKFKTDRIISVNNQESNKRRRFTVAHELAHYIFEFDPEKSIQFFSKFEIDHEKSKPNESRANRFAAELLMPEAEIKKRFEALKKDNSKSYYDIVQELSDNFLTPPKSVELRLKEELNLI